MNAKQQNKKTIQGLRKTIEAQSKIIDQRYSDIESLTEKNDDMGLLLVKLQEECHSLIVDSSGFGDEIFKIKTALWTTRLKWLFTGVGVAKTHESPMIKGDKGKLTAPEAVYGFAAWLTCREKPMTLSSTHDASEICTLVDEFVKTNSLGEPRSNYTDYLTRPKQ